KFGKLEQSRGNGRGFDFCSSQICKQLMSSLSATCANLQSRKIPTRECSPRLFRSAHPLFEFIARRFAFGAIELIEFCKQQWEIRVCVVAIDETLEYVISGLRRFELQMRFSDAEERSEQNRVRRSLRPFQDRLKHPDRAFRLMRNQFEASA